MSSLSTHYMMGPVLKLQNRAKKEKSLLVDFTV